MLLSGLTLLLGLFNSTGGQACKNKEMTMALAPSRTNIYEEENDKRNMIKTNEKDLLAKLFEPKLSFSPKVMHLFHSTQCMIFVLHHLGLELTTFGNHLYYYLSTVL